VCYYRYYDVVDDVDIVGVIVGCVVYADDDRCGDVVDVVVDHVVVAVVVDVGCVVGFGGGCCVFAVVVWLCVCRVCVFTGEYVGDIVVVVGDVVVGVVVVDIDVSVGIVRLMLTMVSMSSCIHVNVVSVVNGVGGGGVAAVVFVC